jgi:hypothetical protein
VVEVIAFEPSEADLEQVAGELRTIVHASQWERVLAIGRLILRRFFNDDEHAWRERRRNKDRSIRKLANRPDCPLAKSALTEAVGIHVLCSKFPEARGSGRVTPTHVAKTLGLEPGLALQLLRTADQESWSVRELAAEATRVRKSMGERRGRPVSRSERRAETWGKRAIKALDHMRAELAASPGPELVSREHLTALCAGIQQRVSAVQALLHPVTAADRRAPPARVSAKLPAQDLKRAAG